MYKVIVFSEAENLRKIGGKYQEKHIGKTQLQPFNVNYKHAEHNINKNVFLYKGGKISETMIVALLRIRS